jgi:hypothetical protein
MMLIVLLLFSYFSLETEKCYDIVVFMLSFIRSFFLGAKGNHLGEMPVVSARKKTKSVRPKLVNSSPTEQVAVLGRVCKLQP